MEREMKTKIVFAKLFFAKLFAVVYLFSTFGVSCGQGKNGPLYASPKTKEIIQKMIQAHGGMENWQKAKSISFDHKMIDPRTPNEPWVSKEFHDPISRRTYQHWPLDNARLAFDGERTWTVNWGKGNPPAMMARVAFYFLNLPWVTQDESVQLAEPGRGKLPHTADSKEFIIVRMTYRDGNPFEYYDLYIDPDDHLLKGILYTVTYRPLFDAFGMPPEVKVMGPFVKAYTDFVDVEGLKMASRYDTFRSLDGKTYVTMGEHYAENFSLNRPFDESRLKMPAGAKIDDSDKRYAEYLKRLGYRKNISAK